VIPIVLDYRIPGQRAADYTGRHVQQATVLKTDDENQRVVAELERLDKRGRPLTPQEESLAEVMTLLVRQFEESKYRWGMPRHLKPGVFSWRIAASATRLGPRVRIEQLLFPTY
jgi:hypothetical protein